MTCFNLVPIIPQQRLKLRQPKMFLLDRVLQLLKISVEL